MTPVSSAPAGAVAKKSARCVLLCLDRSLLSEQCVPFAVSLARTFDTTLTVLHVMQRHSDLPGPRTSDALGWEIASQEARHYLDRIQKEIAHDLGRPVSTRLEQGRPAQRIVDLSRELDADVTVLASHGEGGPQDLSLGTTAQQVLSSSRGSVFIVHTANTFRAPVAPRHILVPLDGSLRTESVLPAAARIASAHGAELLLVHVVEEPVATALLTAVDDVELARAFAGRLAASAERYLARLSQQLAHEVAGVRTLVVRHTNERQCLLEISKREKTDLFVLSAHGSACDSGRSFGSVAAYLLTHSSVPLLVLQDLPGRELQQKADSDFPIALPTLRASYASEIV